MTAADRAATFLAETYRRRVERVEGFSWGELVLTPHLPRVWDANFAIVSDWAGTAAELGREMDSVQERVGFAHRMTVLLDESIAARLWPEVLEQRWEFASRYLLMAYRRPPDRPADPSVEVVGIGEPDWATGRQAMIELEDTDPDLVHQLVQLDSRLSRTMTVRHLAAIVDGQVAAFAGLYLEGDVAQIEDVATLPGYRGRGLARAVVLHAVSESLKAGADLVFLVADEADWPKTLYARLGFDPIGCEHVFGRSGRQHSPA